MRATTRKVQTAFRFDADLLSRLKRKAKARGQSLNAYVENVLVKDTPANLVWPEIVFPADISPETMAITRNYTSFTKEELRKDDRLAYIFGK